MFTVSLSLIRPSPNPIRKTWDEDKMNELAASIKERGVIVPIKVRPVSGPLPSCRYHGIGWIAESKISDMSGESCAMCDAYRDKYGIYDDWQFEDLDPAPISGEPFLEVVYGHRRVEAARRAGLDEIPAIVESTDDTDALIEALIENVQREDMTPYDKGAAVIQLQKKTGWTYAQMESHGVGDDTLLHRWVSYTIEIDGGLSTIVDKQSGGMVQQVEQVRRSLGDDLDAKRAVLIKSGQDDLNWKETRAVADAYKAADSPELRDAVLNTSGKLGDAARILQVAQMSIGANGLVERHEQERRQAFEEYDQAAKDFFDFMKLSKQMVKTAQSAARYGKFSQEAARFAIVRIDTLINELEVLREALNDVQ